jgi:glutamate synthase domain-containing protein 3
MRGSVVVVKRILYEKAAGGVHVAVAYFLGRVRVFRKVTRRDVVDLALKAVAEFAKELKNGESDL